MFKRGSKKKEQQPVKQADSYDVCLILNEYDSIVDELLQVLTSVLKIKVFPGSREIRNRSYDFEGFNEMNRLFNQNYQNSIKGSIKESKIVVAVVTNKFTKSEKCAELLKYARRIKAPIVGLIVEECDNYDKLETGLLKGFALNCPIYEDRVNKVGYDQYLWIGEHFNQFLRHIATQVGKKFTKPRNINKAYYCFSINNESNLSETIRLLSLINSQLEGKDHYIRYFERIPKDTATIVEGIDKHLVNGVAYVDISQMNVSEKMTTTNKDKYRNVDFFDHYEAKLEYLNIMNKSDYLNLVKLFEDLIEDKANELKSESYSSDYSLDDSLTASTEKQNSRNEEQALEMRSRDQFVEIYGRIIKKFARSTNKQIEEMNTIDFFSRHNIMIKETFHRVIEELKILDIDPIKIEFVLRFLNRNNSYFLYETLIRSKIIVIFLTKEFFETEKYQLLFEKFTKLRKKIYIVKLDDFNLNLNAKLKKSVKVYDIHKHKADKFDGYITRKLLGDVKEVLKGKKIVSIIILGQHTGFKPPSPGKIEIIFSFPFYRQTIWSTKSTSIYSCVTKRKSSIN